MSLIVGFGIKVGRCPNIGNPLMLQSAGCRRKAERYRDKLAICSTSCKTRGEEIGYKIKGWRSKVITVDRKYFLWFLKAGKESMVASLARVDFVSTEDCWWFASFHLCWRYITGGITLLLLFLNFVADASSDHPASPLQASYACEDVSHYYSFLEDLEGTKLMEKLHNIVSGHHSLPYVQVWDALEVLDAVDFEHPKDSPNVLEIYSLRAVPKLLAGKPEGWNREHLWPRSYGLTNGPELTDLHNLRPEDVNVNSSRGNKYYGECLSSSSHCLKPANPEAAPDTATDKESWTPPAQVRGDIARSVMYMAVRYGFGQAPRSHNLQLSDSPSIENARMGLLSVLLQWNETDLPSRSEQLRNNTICGIYQHNRNPFVDHPEYATLIWGYSRPEVPAPIDSQSSVNVFLPEKINTNAWINELHYKNKGKDENEFIEVAVGYSMDPSKLKLVLYNGANGKVYRSLSLADGATFSVTNADLGISIYTAFLPAGSLQNGPADGVVLVEERNDSVKVIQFLSYEGVVEAVDGPAQGLKSLDIRVNENKSSTTRDSLGLTGTGFGHFRWTNFVNAASPGKLNKGQNLLTR